MIHPSAEIHPEAAVGADTTIWHRAQIGARARIGDECIVGSAVYVDREVVVGNRVKIQTGAQLYHGATVEDGVFIGPLVCLTNDKHPRAITAEGRLQRDADWSVGEIHVRYGASLGAGAIVLPGVTVGRFAMVAAGAVVADDVPDYGLVVGVPARLVGYACACGRPLRRHASRPSHWTCPTCRVDYLHLEGSGLRPAARSAEASAR